MHVQLVSFVRLFAIPRIVARQTPLSLDFPGRNAGVGCPLLLSRTFLTQGSDPSPVLAGVFFTTAPSGEPDHHFTDRENVTHLRSYN